MKLTEEMARRHIDHIIKVEIPETYQRGDLGNLRVLGRTLEDYILDMEKMGIDIRTEVEKEGFLLDIDYQEVSQ